SVMKMLFLLSFILLLDNVENAGVVKPTLGSIQLVDGTSSCSGRVEIYTDDWGTICDMDATEGNMICMEVGCGPLSVVKKSAFFGEGSGPLLTDDLNCFGNENLVMECEWDNHTDACDHSNDVGVICDPIVRLWGGSSICSGRVEIFHNRVWGTVCDNGWDTVDAAVVCKQQGCGKPTTVYSNAAVFGSASGQIWMDGLSCTGREDSVEECTFNGWGVVSCTHADDAGLICAEVALVDGDDACSGRVEILYPKWGWGTICDEDWNLLGGDVICKELGCGSAIYATTGSTFNKGTGPIWTFNKNCSGAESHVKSCLAIGTANTCNHNKEAGVVCRQVRLASASNNSCQGTVQVYHDGQWGSMCHNGWDVADGVVLCRELGCGGNVQPLPNAFFGQTAGKVWMDYVGCTSEESNLRDCEFGGWGKSTCSHAYDAGVVCKIIRNVLRFEVTASEVNPNSPTVKNQILDKLRQEIQKTGEYTVNWRIQSNKLVFQEKTIFDP
ncbi:putative deleted in malignant brain tumors 1 protein, partial [Triplophysa rosa]